MSIHAVITDLIERCREPLAKSDWELVTISGPQEDCTASCEAMPEYRRAKLTFDPEKLETGSDVAEIVVHELAHCDTWELHTLCEELAKALAESAPKPYRKALKKLLLEKVRQAGERCTTDVGHTYLRLLRRAGVLDTPPANG
jgi:hypothetical protein